MYITRNIITSLISYNIFVVNLPLISPLALNFKPTM